MDGVRRGKFHNLRRSFRKCPEWCSVSVSLFRGVDMQQWHYVIAKIFLEFFSRINYTIFKTPRTFLKKTQRLTQSFHIQILIIFKGDLLNYVGQGNYFLIENLPKLVQCPLQAVDALLRKHLKCANWNLMLLLLILLISVSFGLKRYDHLNMAFSS